MFTNLLTRVRELFIDCLIHLTFFKLIGPPGEKSGLEHYNALKSNNLEHTLMIKVSPLVVRQARMGKTLIQSVIEHQSL